jgi:hypothetical protein
VIIAEVLAHMAGKFAVACRSPLCDALAIVHPVQYVFSLLWRTLCQTSVLMPHQLL